MRGLGHFLALFALTVLVVAAPAAAQNAAQRGKLIITVSDTTGGVLPGATVTVIGLDPATKADIVPSVKTTDQGVASFNDLVLGRYSVRAEFSGFDMGLLRDFKVNRGDNKHVVVLAVKSMSESVTV